MVFRKAEMPLKLEIETFLVESNSDAVNRCNETCIVDSNNLRRPLGSANLDGVSPHTWSDWSSVGERVPPTLLLPRVQGLIAQRLSTRGQQWRAELISDNAGPYSSGADASRKARESWSFYACSSSLCASGALYNTLRKTLRTNACSVTAQG